MKIYIDDMRKYLNITPATQILHLHTQKGNMWTVLQCTENNQQNPPIELDLLSINETKYIGENEAIYWLYFPILNYLTLS